MKTHILFLISKNKTIIEICLKYSGNKEEKPLNLAGYGGVSKRGKKPVAQSRDKSSSQTKKAFEEETIPKWIKTLESGIFKYQEVISSG